jgi:poly(A) polymerase
VDRPLDVLAKLKDFFSARQYPAFLVGGYLRDSLLSLPPEQDLDIAVAGDSQRVGRELAQVMGGVFVSLSPAHDVARVVAAAPKAGAREETGSMGGRWTVDLAGFSGSIEEDLERRDFTINAMALPIQGWALPVHSDLIIDPFNGRQDLGQKRIRAVTQRVFQDDPGRLMRAVRLAASLGFRLEPETARLVRSEAHRVTQVSGERVRDELLAILSLDGARGHLEVLDRLDLLCRIIPELAGTKGVDQPKEHYWDVWGHLVHTVETAERVTKGHQNSPIYSLVYWTAETDAHFGQKISDGHTRRTFLKLAALFHDISKPETKHVDETGRTRFPDHSGLGSAVAAKRLTHLRVGSRGIATVRRIIEEHLRPTHMMQGVEQPTNRAIYRFFRDLGDAAIDTLYISLADYLGAKGPELDLDDWSNHARMVAHVLQVGMQPPPPKEASRPLNGHDLMEHFNLDPSPLIGMILASIDEAWAAGEITTREEALASAAKVLDCHREQN